MVQLGYTNTIFSGTAIASGNTHDTPVITRYVKEASIFLKVTTVAGVNPTLDLTIEIYNPVTDAWHTLATFDQKTEAGQDEGFVEYGLGEKMACSYVIGGTTPSFTFTVDATFK